MNLAYKISERMHEVKRTKDIEPVYHRSPILTPRGSGKTFFHFIHQDDEAVETWTEEMNALLEERLEPWQRTFLQERIRRHQRQEIFNRREDATERIRSQISLRSGRQLGKTNMIAAVHPNYMRLIEESGEFV